MKIGDELKCVDDNESSSLFQGGKYYVREINQYGNIRVSDSGGFILPHFYKPDRFKLSIFEVKVAKQNKPTPKPTLEPTAEKIDLSKKYKQKDGTTVHLIGRGQYSTYPIIGECIYDNGEASLEQWTEFGKYNSQDESQYDLVEITDEIKLELGDDVSVVIKKGSFLIKLDHDDWVEFEEEEISKIRYALDEVYCN